MSQTISLNFFSLFLAINFNENNYLLIFDYVAFCSLHIFTVIMISRLHIDKNSLNIHSPSSALQQPASLLAMRHAFPWALHSLECANSLHKIVIAKKCIVILLFENTFLLKSGLLLFFMNPVLYYYVWC